MNNCQLRYMFTKTTMDEERLHQENPGGTASPASVTLSVCQDQVKGEIHLGKEIKASTTAGTQADACSPLPDCSDPKNKRQKRLPHSSCCRTVTYDHKRGTFIARNLTVRKEWRRVERIKNMTQRGHSKSEQKESTARKTTNPACPRDYMETKSSETVQHKEMIDCTNLYELQGSLTRSDVLHKSKRMAVSPPSVVTHNKRQLEIRRNCWLGSPRIPNGYPSFHCNKKVGKKTARASLRTGIPGKYVQKYSSNRLPHQGQKVPLKSCPVYQPPAEEKKDESMKHDGENTVGRPGTLNCDLSKHRPGESLVSHQPLLYKITLCYNLLLPSDM
ncbi:PREDICTED: uncharacterized protein LOC109465607 [Branchiostoma belcheri]|uniref:Uncharacterized protein LOC109465607 n=1 Tax=Branchiostoma belcheri TaxID=7741 RepID=A0A6P4Y891_BRABE|nr:PREDICTED: uncharacterized protein LOC109465607 [Branchiostoma belcheri]